MSRQDQPNMRETLETLCAQWAALGPEDTGKKLDVQSQIFEIVFDLFKGREDEIVTVFLNDWQKFDPARGSAYDFFSVRLRYQKLNAYRKQKTHQDRTVTKLIQLDSGEEEDPTDRLPAGWDSDPELLLMFDAAACELLIGILELPKRLQGQANNPTRHRYFRLFFTNNAVTCLHGFGVPESWLRRERDLFAAMQEEFLDFFLRERCRTIPDVCRSPLKLHGELVEGQRMEETELPLPGDVYASYLNVGENTVSQQKKFYLQEVRNWLF